MTLAESLSNPIVTAVKDLFSISLEKVEFQATRKEFEGDITVVLFPLLKHIKSNPAELGAKIGDYLVQEFDFVDRYNVVSGFLNVVIADSYYAQAFQSMQENKQFGHVKTNADSEVIMVEYSSPNTNKPLHLGHVRNNLLGFSVAEILKAAGKKVYKTQIINDRGIHICKSMLAWQKFGNGETPSTSNLKGDKLVGKYYVAFDKAYKEEIAELVANGKTEDEAKKEAPIILQAKQMLLDWEAGNEKVVTLWKTMNQWVYDGFNSTYTRLGVNFDSYYYESNTYLLGKDVVQMGLAKGIFEQDPDGSVWIDLTQEGLDRKIVLHDPRYWHRHSTSQRSSRCERYGVYGG